MSPRAKHVLKQLAKDAFAVTVLTLCAIVLGDKSLIGNEISEEQVKVRKPAR